MYYFITTQMLLETKKKYEVNYCKIKNIILHAQKIKASDKVRSKVSENS